MPLDSLLILAAAGCVQQRQRNLQSGLCRHRGYAPDLAGCGAEQSCSPLVARVSSLEQSNSPSPNVHAEGPDIDPSTGQAIPGKAKTCFNIVFVSSEVGACSLRQAMGPIFECWLLLRAAGPAPHPLYPPEVCFQLVLYLSLLRQVSMLLLSSVLGADISTMTLAHAEAAGSSFERRVSGCRLPPGPKQEALGM